MKSNEKTNVIEAFVAHRKDPKALYIALVAILLKLSNATQSQKRYYNASRYSPGTLSSLEYDIKKLTSVTDRDIRKALKVEKKDEQKTSGLTPLPEELKVKLQALDLAKADYNKDLKPLAKALTEVLSKEPDSQKKVDLIAFIDAHIEKGPSLEDLKADFSKALESAPEEVKKGLKIRDMYPFLNDDDCPDEFHTLTGKMVSAYINWKEGRKEIKSLLEAGATNEEIFEVAKKTVENFELNLEIHDELNYYNEHKEILGKHPIFAEHMLFKKVDNLGTVELTKRQKNLRTYISRDQKKFDKMEDGEPKTNFGKKLQGFKDELELIDARLEKIS